MSPRGYKRITTRTSADYDRGITMLAGIDRIAGLLAQDFPDCPRVLLVTTALGDAHRELTDRREALMKSTEVE